MRIATILSAILLAVTCLPAGAQDAATRKVEGRGVEGRPAYRGGGVVKFLDVQLGAQVVHYKPGDGLPWPLEVTYDVLEPAPVLLTSRLGTEHWRLYDFDAETMSPLYTDEKINLTQRGRHTAKATKAHFGKSYGPLPDSGLVGIRGHYYFLTHQPNGQWLDVTDPPAFFDQPEPAQRLIVTLADLTRYELSIPKIQSTWKPGGPFRVRLVVTDASETTYPVVNAPLVASSGDWLGTLTTALTPLPAIWVSTSDIGTVADIDGLVNRCRFAGLNTIVPDIFVRNTFLATSKLTPAAESVSNDFDPLRYLIQKAHAARLEVHPWFCVTYRDRHFRRWFADKFRAAVDIFSNLSGGASQGQGPAGWAQQGWMDLILPMDYQMQTLQVRANERQFLAALAKDDQYGTRCALLPLRRGFRSP